MKYKIYFLNKVNGKQNIQNEVEQVHTLKHTLNFQTTIKTSIGSFSQGK